MLTSRAIPFREPKTKRPIGKTERVRPGMTIRSGFGFVALSAVATKECEDDAGESDSGGETRDPGAEVGVTFARSPEAVNGSTEGTELTARVGFGALAREVVALLSDDSGAESSVSSLTLVVDDRSVAAISLLAEAREDRAARTNRCLLADEEGNGSDSAQFPPGAYSTRSCASSRCLCVDCVVSRGKRRAFKAVDGER